MLNTITTWLRAGVVAAVAVIGAHELADAQAKKPAKRVEAKLTATHGDWEIRCYPDKNCFMSQTKYNPDGSRAAAMNVIKLPSPVKSNEGPIVAIADIYTPLNVFLAQGMGLRIDGGSIRRVPFTLCSIRGCLSKARMLSAQVEAWKGGGKVEAMLMIQDKGRLKGAAVPFSLKGFTAAFDALTPIIAAKPKKAE